MLTQIAFYINIDKKKENVVQRCALRTSYFRCISQRIKNMFFPFLKMVSALLGMRKNWCLSRVSYSQTFGGEERVKQSVCLSV